MHFQDSACVADLGLGIGALKVEKQKHISFYVLTKVFTKVEVTTLVFGLEEASPRLGMNVSSLFHQQLHILLTASFDGNVERCLA